MPRGKELEQLPIANSAPGALKDTSGDNKQSPRGVALREQPEPSDIDKENEDMV
ncbi:MAG: hypothetical protein K6T88_06530 [Bacillus sp. (in: Bacteria)]|nr:hypothetical protein [Bacillus sp. (in: firmicutes)]